MDNKTPNNKQADENTPARLNEFEAKYRLLMDLSVDGLIIVQDGLIKENNGSFARLCGLQQESILNTALGEYFPQDENPALMTMLDDHENRTGTSQLQQATLAGGNSQLLKVEIMAAGCEFQNKPAHFLVIRDISDRQTARESLEKAGKLDAIAALSGGIAHDYNNLLTAIIGNITLAQTHMKSKDKPFRLLGHALVASKTAKNLTQKLITFSKGGSPVKDIANEAPPILP
jgi:PAS domain S-box-containing protein